VPGLARRVEVETPDPLLGAGHAEPTLARELEHLAGALVEQHVAARGIGMLGAQPRRADLAPRLLVGDEQELQGAAGGTPAGTGERCAGDRLGRNLVLHVQGAATPEEPVDDLARPRVVAPVGRVGQHRVEVAEQAQHRAVVAAAQRRHQIRAVLVGRQQLRLESRRAQVGVEMLDRRALVAGRVDRVETDQLAEQLHRLVLQLVCGHWRERLSA